MLCIVIDSVGGNTSERNRRISAQNEPNLVSRLVRLLIRGDADWLRGHVDEFPLHILADPSRGFDVTREMDILEIETGPRVRVVHPEQSRPNAVLDRDVLHPDVPEAHERIHGTGLEGELFPVSEWEKRGKRGGRMNYYEFGGIFVKIPD